MISAWLLFFSIRATLTSIFVTIQRRHLMMPRVFAPKYVFDVAFMLSAGIISVLLLGFSLLFQSSPKEQKKNLPEQIAARDSTTPSLIAHQHQRVTVKAD